MRRTYTTLTQVTMYLYCPRRVLASGGTLEVPAYIGNVVKGKVPEKISIFVNSAHKGSMKRSQRICDTFAKDYDMLDRVYL